MIKKEIPGNSLKLQIQVEAVLSGHEDWVHSTEWSNDGKQLVTSSSDKSIIVWRQKGNDDIWVDEVGFSWYSKIDL